MQKTENTGAGAAADIEKMFEVGAHYGYTRGRRHPSISPYIYATKKNGDIIDLEKTSALLQNAAEFVKHLGSQNKIMLLVGAKPEARDTIKNAAEKLSMPFVALRWIGGTISNFGEIKKRIAELEKYNKDVAEGNLEKYTKKERVVLAKKMEKLTKYYSGLLSLKKTPDALFVIDAKAEKIAVTEARDAGVPVVALLNSDSDIKAVDWPIVANDASVPSIKLFVNAIVSAYEEGKMSIPEPKIETKK